MEHESSTDQKSKPSLVWKEIKDRQLFEQVPTSVACPKPSDCTRIVCISDTHSRHRDLAPLPAGDILVHAGDISQNGEISVLQDLSNYFGELTAQQSAFQEIIVIAGNHDRTLHKEHYLQRNPGSERKCDVAKQLLGQNAVYLQDDSHITAVGGLEIYGSPWCPKFFDWAFMLNRGDGIRERWATIPSSTDILVVHGPPLGRGDFVPGSGNVGCYDLLKEIQIGIKPRVCISGHIHEGYGSSFDGTTLFVNACAVDTNYLPINQPIVIDVPNDLTKPAMVVRPSCCDFKLQDLPALCIDKGWIRLKDALDEADLEAVSNSLPLEFSMVHPHAHAHLSARLQLSKRQQLELARVLRAFHARHYRCR